MVGDVALLDHTQPTSCRHDVFWTIVDAEYGYMGLQFVLFLGSHPAMALLAGP